MEATAGPRLNAPAAVRPSVSPFNCGLCCGNSDISCIIGEVFANTPGGAVHQGRVNTVALNPGPAGAFKVTSWDRNCFVTLKRSHALQQNMKKNASEANASPLRLVLRPPRVGFDRR